MSAAEADTPTLWMRRRARGAASLVLPALAACAQSIPPRQVKRPPSHITAKERKDGGSGCWRFCDSSGRYYR